MSNIKQFLIRAFLCGILLVSSSIAAISQISLTMKNRPVREVIKEIEKVSDYRFFYNDELSDLNKIISIDVKNGDIKDIMELIARQAAVSYVLKANHQVVLSLATVNQQKDVVKITGKVIDDQGEGVIGANVMEKGTTNGTITNMDGEFSLEVPNKATLQISYIGFNTQEIPVNGQKTFTIRMTEDTQSLDEVVVVGYGTQKKLNVTGAVATLKNEELVKSPVASTTNALVGRLPGLIAKQKSGQPGFDAADINIRSFGSALVIVDGVEQSFNNIDANEIESVSILKDASAAIYGARAGNGVILVTTKRGQSGKPNISFNGTLTSQSYTNFPEPVNAGQYATLFREAQINSGIPENQTKFSEEDIAKYFAGNDPQYPSTNWYDEIMKKSALQQQYNLTIRGGTDVVKYYTFLGYLSQDGMFKGGNTGYRRFNVRSNLDVNLTSDLTFSLDLSAIKDDVRQSNRPASEEWFWMDFFDSTPTSHASFPDPTKVPHIGPGPFNAIINTHEDLGGYDKTYKNTLNGAFTVNYKVRPVPGLSAKLKLNYQQVSYDRKNWTKQNDIWDYDYATDTYTLYGKSMPTSLKQEFHKNQVITGQFSLNYDRVINKDHAINGLALVEIIDYNNGNFSAYRENYVTSAIDQLFAGGTINQQANGSASVSGRASFVARANYAYQGKYLLEATARYDGSPNFPKDKRWGFFPSLSAGWRMSEEAFIKNNLTWIDNLKLRAGVSQTGFDSVGAFQYLTGYKFEGYNVLGGKEVPGLTTTGIANTNISWETMTLYNVGLDLSVLNNKLYSEIDVFYRKRDDMLGTRVVSLPNTFGATLPSENINSQSTRGFEVLIGHRGNFGEFSYDISGNVSWSRSKWIHYDEPDYTDPDDIRLKKKSGQWIDVYNAYKSDGLFTSQEEIDNLGYDMDGMGNTSLRPGDIKILDLNNDGEVDWRDASTIGSGGTPHIIYGINLNMKYKGFDLSVFAQGAADYYVQLQSGNINIDGVRTPFKVIWNERWTPENNDRNAIIPRQKIGQTTNNWNSDYWYKNASYLRLKNLTLGYTFDKGLIRNLRMENLRLFVVGTNLFAINPLRKYGLDPETPDATRGWSYPVTKSVSLGLNVTF
ncbi:MULTISPECIES: TonB-dependent receptor [Parabacteroides]|jgi:tonB-linked outer membrane protein, susC/ragA family|uniref:TonB-linked SusC/RagA family outer membrane protein n=1 Tax=Parabacteroides faecis TaxID=1217282 RepID=A0ABR6KMX3_9BACT|nr:MULTISPECIES: TonB-dependent receptor [Parabacteroides]MBB4622184.1 TonB-linked SusC/RagA family outer membrane protein [Parabacteroides faecis]RHR38038.1 SusC/RagA family TonB-linked outer membrane protein [Parabacteroides sp. AF18-52]